MGIIVESTTGWRVIVDAENVTDELTLRDLVRNAAVEVLMDNHKLTDGEVATMSVQIAQLFVWTLEGKDAADSDS